MWNFKHKIVWCSRFVWCSVFSTDLLVVSRRVFKPASTVVSVASSNILLLLLWSFVFEIENLLPTQESCMVLLCVYVQINIFLLPSASPARGGTNNVERLLPVDGCQPWHQDETTTQHYSLCVGQSNPSTAINILKTAHSIFI